MERGKAIPELPVFEAIAAGRDHLPTADAAKAIGRAGQTLRAWAAFERGPIRPIRINGRLAWPVADLRRVLQGEAA